MSRATNGRVRRAEGEGAVSDIKDSRRVVENWLDGPDQNAIIYGIVFKYPRLYLCILHAITSNFSRTGHVQPWTCIHGVGEVNGRFKTT